MMKMKSKQRNLFGEQCVWLLLFIFLHCVIHVSSSEDETTKTVAVTATATAAATTSLSISESQVVFWPSDPEERSTSVQLTCTSLNDPYQYCSWLRPDGEECRVQQNCRNSGITISDNGTTCSATIELSDKNPFSGQWQCNVINHFHDGLLARRNATTYVYKISDENNAPKLKQVNPDIDSVTTEPVNIDFECQFESPGPRNELQWTLNDEILKSEIFDENSENFTIESIFVSRFSLQVDRSYFGSRIGCLVSKQDSNGYLLEFEGKKNNRLVVLQGHDEKRIEFKLDPKFVATNYSSETAQIIVESWPIVTFGLLKLETNESSDTTQNEDIRFFCREEDCQLKYDPKDEDKRVFTEIRLEKLNQTWTKFDLKLDPDLLTLGRSRLTILFGQAGDEDDDDPELTSLEISLVHLESEREQTSDTNLMTSDSNLSLPLTIGLFLVLALLAGALIFIRFRRNFSNFFQRGVYDVVNLEPTTPEHV